MGGGGSKTKIENYANVLNQQMTDISMSVVNKSVNETAASLGLQQLIRITDTKVAGDVTVSGVRMAQAGTQEFTSLNKVMREKDVKTELVTEVLNKMKQSAAGAEKLMPTFFGDKDDADITNKVDIKNIVSTTINQHMENVDMNSCMATANFDQRIEVAYTEIGGNLTIEDIDFSQDAQQVADCISDTGSKDSIGTTIVKKVLNEAEQKGRKDGLVKQAGEALPINKIVALAGLGLKAYQSGPTQAAMERATAQRQSPVQGGGMMVTIIAVIVVVIVVVLVIVLAMRGGGKKSRRPRMMRPPPGYPGMYPGYGQQFMRTPGMQPGMQPGMPMQPGMQMGRPR